MLASAGSAAADTLSPAAYRARLVEARSLIAAGRLEDARALLLRTDALEVSGGTIRVDDRTLALRITSAGSLAALDLRIAAADRALRDPVDPATARARLRELLARSGPAAGGSFAAVIVAVLDRAYDLIGRPSPALGIPALVLAALLLAATVVVILARGVRERIRREVRVAYAQRAGAPDPARRLAEADGAVARGDVRAAIHAYYRFALESLAAREAISYDPALTDRELVARAAAVPHVEALRELIALNERTWFGLRPAGAGDVSAARRLAQRVAP